MRKLLYNIILLTSVVGLAVSCSKDFVLEKQTDATSSGFEIALAFPEMEDVITRAIGDNNAATKLEDLDIFLFVFDGTNLLQTIHIDKTDATRSVENGILKFNVGLPQTDNNAIIHIIAINDTDETFAKQINDNGYGIEDTVMPALSVTGNKDSYWQRVDLKTPIIVTVNNSYNNLEDVKGTEDLVRPKLKIIPLIRNFAKISVTKSSRISDERFKILGWTVVNERVTTSAVPWYSKSGDPDILYPDYYDNITNRGRSYSELTSDGYQGVSQQGSGMQNTPADVTGNPWSWNNNYVPTKYLYERKISSVNPLYILVYGNFNGTNGYYKLSLGHTDTKTGLFTEYNVLRNISYNVVIESITSEGSETAADALAGPAFNNISGDALTQNMSNIADGVAMLYVNQTRYVVTLPGQTWDFKFRLRPNIRIKPAVYDNSKVFFEEAGIGISTGNVIKNYTVDRNEDGTIKQDADGWSTIHIEFYDPSDELKLQSFTVYSEPGDDITDPNITMGLSRTINLVLRNKWEFLNMEIFPGLWEDDKKWPNYNPGTDTPEDQDVNYFIGPNIGDPLTIFFELPSGLPQAIFPLNFTFESDKQNIENAGEGTAVVQSGPSLFPNVYDHRISYVKTLTWEEYAANDGESTAASRIQRARFLTTTAITSLPGTSYTTTVILHNDYFEDMTDKFERREGKNVTDPSN